MLTRRSFVASTAMVFVARGRAMAASDTSGLVAPAEEAAHARTWMCWPSSPHIYGGSTSYYESVQSTLARLATAISDNEPVVMLAASRHHAQAAQLCGPNVQLLDIPTDDMWARDSGPVFLQGNDGARAVLDLNFNGWGGKQSVPNDKLVAGAIARHLGHQHIRAGIVGECGGVEFDGEGTLILTDSCWVNENRNPGKSKSDIEVELKRGFGVQKVVWLPGVRGGDITDGHIDGSIRFVRPGVLLTSGYPGDTSEWARVLGDSRKILQRETDAKGRSFEIVDLPSAVNVRSTHPEMFTGYANFYVGNGAVYTPEFGDKSADAQAQETLQKLYPGRKVVALEVDRIYENGGGIHCVTQQEPA